MMLPTVMKNNIRNESESKHRQVRLKLKEVSNDLKPRKEKNCTFPINSISKRIHQNE